MGRAKLNELLGAGFVLLAGLFALSITVLVVGLLPQDLARNATQLARLGIAVGLALCCVIVFEGANWRLRQSIAMNEAKTRLASVGIGDRPVYKQIAAVTSYTDVVKQVFWIVVLAGFTAFVAYLTLRNPIRLTAELIAYLATYPVWLVVRKPVLGGLGKALDSIGVSTICTIEPSGEGLTLDGLAGMRHGKAPVRIGFAELDDLRVLTPVETEAYLKYELGPNLDIAARQTKDLYKFAKGEIPRPTVYGLTARNSTGLTVLMRGPELFYLINFATEVAEGIGRAYQAYRASRTTSASR